MRHQLTDGKFTHNKWKLFRNSKNAIKYTVRQLLYIPYTKILQCLLCSNINQDKTIEN